MPEEEIVYKRVAKWYHGGVASAMAACCTHPLDLIKVHLQTVSADSSGKKIGMVRMGVKVLKGDGIMGLYNGLSASVLRQLTYSMTRFAIYESVKNNVLADEKGQMPFYQKVLLGGFAGTCGGIVGTPADMINVRRRCDVEFIADFGDLTYSLSRFGIYESVKNNYLVDEHGQMPFYQKVLLGGFAGTCGGLVGTPADMINVRYNTSRWFTE